MGQGGAGRRRRRQWTLLLLVLFLFLFLLLLLLLLFFPPMLFTTPAQVEMGKIPGFKDRLQAVKDAEQEMRRAGRLHSSLVGEWVQAEAWADLSPLADVEDVRLPRAHALALAAADQARSKVAAETAALDHMRRVQDEAAAFSDLVQKQVTWCAEVAQASLSAAERDIREIDQQIEDLLERRAAKAAARSALTWRLKQLEEQAALEAARLRDFMAEYEARESVARERVEHAKNGAAAADQFLNGFSSLGTLLRKEIKELRTCARDLQADVGADCVWSWSLACKVNHMLAYYEGCRVKSLEEDLQRHHQSFRSAFACGREDEAPAILQKIGKVEADVAKGKEKIVALEKDTERMNQGNASVWTWLCGEANGNLVFATADAIWVRILSPRRVLPTPL
mmetsp:Transcript_80638/g.216102  ORF Transcript_80638/g.216102 Transcript_80638/m.216102 type:complete len:395 (+) Transcript_80638:543-1727(+)